jgi:hypothetical protein
LNPHTDTLTDISSQLDDSRVGTQDVFADDEFFGGDLGLDALS